MNDLKIKDLKLANNLILAPLAGVTDVTFRTICKEFGVALTFTEMISAKGLMYDNKNTCELLKTSEIEKPVGVQLFGSDKDIMASEAVKIQDKFNIIDINMGCPVPKIVKNGEGSALMLDMKLASQIIDKVATSVNIPVSVKFRKGFNDKNINAVDFAKMAEDSGASMITIHGRTREEFYRGKADWNIIREVKSNVSIPVVGNGDVYTREDYKRIIEETGCDAVMIARGTLGNPWLIEEILKDIDIEVTNQMKKEMALKHTKMLIEELGEERAMIEIRKHVIWYMKNMPNSAKLRESISRVNTYEELYENLSKI